MSRLSTEDAVERHLALRLARVRGDRMADVLELEWACSAVKALEAAGALSAARAAAWARRFTRTALGPHAAEPKLRERALTHVAELLRREESDAARVAVDAFRSLGLLSDQDQLALLAPTSFDDELAGQAARLDVARAFRDDRPIRVLAGPNQRIGGLRVTAIELFEASVAVHWHFSSRFAKGFTGEELSEELDSAEPLFSSGPPRTSEIVLRMAAPLIGLKDERGTEYTGFRCEEVRSSPEAVGRSGFVPGLPVGARRLGISIGEGVLWVEL